MATIALCNCCEAHVSKDDACHRSYPGYWGCKHCPNGDRNHRCSFRKPPPAPSAEDRETGEGS